MADTEKKRPKTAATVAPVVSLVTPAPETEQVEAPAKGKIKRRLPADRSVSLGWTLARRKAVTTHVHKLAPMLRLQDWTIKVMWDAGNDDTDEVYATNTPQGDSHHCEIRFSKKFLELDNKEMTQCIIHELMHCHLFVVEDYTEDVVREVTTRKTANVFTIGFTKLIETSVDSIADAFTELLPEFDMPDK